jgi:hypothetical protein
MSTVTVLDPETIGGVLEWLGKTTRQALTFGGVKAEIAAFGDGSVRVWFPDHGVADGAQELVLSPDETTELARAALHVGYVARLRRDELAGHNAIRVEERNGRFLVSYRGIQQPVRLGKLRTCISSCSECRVEGREFWIADGMKSAWGWARLCDNCIRRLSKAPAGLRRVV